MKFYYSFYKVSITREQNLWHVAHTEKENHRVISFVKTDAKKNPKYSVSVKSSNIFIE